MLYSLSQRTTSVSTGTAAWEIRASAANKAKVLEIGLSLAITTTSVWGFGRPAAIGITPTSPQNFLDEQGDGPVGQTTGALAWGTGPTVPTSFFRRISVNSVLGVGAVMLFPRGMPILAGGSIVMWNIITGNAADVWAVVDE